MFGYKIDGVWADLIPGQTVKLSRVNNLFEFESIRGSLVNDFSLPFTPKNDKLFGWYREDKMRYQNREYYCEVVADGYIIERGYIELADLTETEYVVVFTQNLSEFFGVWQLESIKKMPWGSITPTPVKDVNHLTAEFCWPTVDNTGFYGTNAQSGFNGGMNKWSASTLNAHARVPMLFLRFLFDKITTVTGVAFSGEFFESELFKRAIIFNTYSMDDATVMYYANHLPELTLIDTIKELRKWFNLNIVLDVSKKTARISFAETLLQKKATLDWTKKIVPGSGRTPDKLNRLKLATTLDGNDEMMKAEPLPAGFDAYITPETQRGNLWEMQTKWSTIYCNPAATVRQQGITPRFNQMGGSFSPRLGLWGGMVADVPVITNSTNGWNLTWSGANNIKDKCWATWEKIKASTSAKVVMANLNAIDLYHIDWSSNPDAHHAIIIRGKEYYVMSVDTLLPLRGVSQLVLLEKNV